ncbi:MAG TPA: hypothetical protein VGJ15_12685 [Pirellulales bacterium]|jgi:hypothetical protein
MATATILDRIFEPFGEALTPETARRIVDWHADVEIERRLDELGNKSNDGILSTEEREEYETYVRAIDFIGILQAKARGTLKRANGS